MGGRLVEIRSRSDLTGLGVPLDVARLGERGKMRLPERGLDLIRATSWSEIGDRRNGVIDEPRDDPTPLFVRERRRVRGRVVGHGH